MKDKARDAAWHKDKYWADETVRERRRETARAYYHKKKQSVAPTETPTPIEV